MPRTARVQLDSRRMGDVVFHPGGIAAQARSDVMRSMTISDYYDRMDWLYGEGALQ